MSATGRTTRPAWREASWSWVIIPSYSGRGSHSGSAASPIQGSTSCSVRNSWPVHTTSGEVPTPSAVAAMTSPTGCTGPTPSKTPVCPDSTLRTIHSAMSRASMICTRSSGDPGPRTGPALGPAARASTCTAPTGRRGRRSARAGSPSTARRRRGRVARRRPSCRRTPPGPRPGRGPPRSPRPAGRRCRGPASRCRCRRSPSTRTPSARPATRPRPSVRATGCARRRRRRRSSSLASSAGTSSARSQTTCRAPSGTSPDRPRVTHVTSCPRATASAAVALERNTLPPSTRIRMRTPDPVGYLRGKRFRSERTPGATCQHLT